MKKLLTICTLLALITFTTISAYAIIQYIQVSVQDNVQVGEVIQEEDSLSVTLISKEEGQLTYYTIDNGDKHSIEYIYAYEQHKEGNIEISANDDIWIEYTVGEVISIVVSLNQEKEFTAGEILDITFTFSVSDAININTASVAELESVGFTNAEAVNIYNFNIVFTDLNNLIMYITIDDPYNRFQEKIDSSIIVFE